SRRQWERRRAAKTSTPETCRKNVRPPPSYGCFRTDEFATSARAGSQNNGQYRQPREKRAAEQGQIIFIGHPPHQAIVMAEIEPWMMAIDDVFRGLSAD